jgi:hypothetical protein
MRSHNARHRPRIVASCAVPNKAINHLEGYGIALVEMDNDRIHRTDSGADNQAALREEISGNPRGRDKATYWSGPASPRGIKIACDKHVKTFFVEEVVIWDQYMAGFEDFVFHLNADRVPDVHRLADSTIFCPYSNGS